MARRLGQGQGFVRERPVERAAIHGSRTVEEVGSEYVDQLVDVSPYYERVWLPLMGTIRKLGVAPVHFHDLQRTHVAWFIAGGVPLPQSVPSHEGRDRRVESGRLGHDDGACGSRAGSIQGRCRAVDLSGELRLPRPARSASATTARMAYDVQPTLSIWKRGVHGVVEPSAWNPISTRLTLLRGAQPLTSTAS